MAWPIGIFGCGTTLLEKIERPVLPPACAACSILFSLEMKKRLSNWLYREIEDSRASRFAQFFQRFAKPESKGKDW